MAQGVHPNSRANLAKGAFKKGQSGNPKGKPGGTLDYKKHFHRIFLEACKAKYPDGRIDDATLLEAIIMAQMSKAHKGDVKAAQFVFERAFGKEKDQVELTGKDGLPLQIDHTSGLRDAQQRLADAIAKRSNNANQTSTSDRPVLPDGSRTKS